MELFKQLIHVDFVAIMAFIYLAIFMRVNRSYDQSINKYYMLSLGLVTALTVTDNFDYYYSNLPQPHPAHRYFIMGGYILRVFLIMSAVLILKRNGMATREHIFLLSPALLNTVVILSSLFHNGVFWIDENNVLHRELLSYTPHVTSLAYFFITLGLSIKRYRQGYKDEARLLFVSLAAIMTGVVSEIVLKTRGVLISAVLLMLAFYYLYLHMEHFKRDTLTGALNRMSFFADLKRLEQGQITALCEIDMNGLKQINDTQGHSEGDKAINTVAKAVLKCLPDKCYLYRLGGDEFAVLFCKTTMQSVQETIESIRKEMTKTPYSCAIGIAEWDDNLSFTDIYNLADSRMYEDKKRMKGTA